MTKVKDLPKTYELSDEDAKNWEPKPDSKEEVCYICKQRHDSLTGRGDSFCSRYWRPEPPKNEKWETRPWGRYLVLYDSSHCKVKRIIVNPGQRLSYQSHNQRKEMWTVSYGKATVTVSDVTYDVGYGYNVYIDKGVKHRLANNTENLIEIIEVQTGSYFGEDDIIRYQDDYNRDGLNS